MTTARVAAATGVVLVAYFAVPSSIWVAAQIGYVRRRRNLERARAHAQVAQVHLDARDVAA